jgi:ankyrin repeat protein
MKSKRKKLNRDMLDSVIMGDISRVRELLRQGADVNARDTEHNETPLMLAVKFAKADIVRLLLDAGAEVNARNDWGKTALFYAPVFSDVFAALLEVGADVHALDKEGNSILMQMVSKSPSLAEAEELLRLGVDQSLLNEDGKSALDIAESLGLVKIIERLRQRRANNGLQRTRR